MMDSILSALDKVRRVSGLDLTLSIFLAALNLKFKGVPGWEPVYQGFTATLRDTVGNDHVEPKTVWADIVPTGWPKTSSILVRIDLYPDDKWILATATIYARHLTVDNRPLVDVRLDLVSIDGMVFIHLASTDHPSIQKAFQDVKP
jgi:hypothetical protein